jgi:hypothetical protein
MFDNWQLVLRHKGDPAIGECDDLDENFDARWIHERVTKAVLKTFKRASTHVDVILDADVIAPRLEFRNQLPDQEINPQQHGKVCPLCHHPFSLSDVSILRQTLSIIAE